MHVDHIWKREWRSMVGMCRRRKEFVTPSIWLFRVLNLVTSTIVGDNVIVRGHSFSSSSPLCHLYLFCLLPLHLPISVLNNAKSPRFLSPGLPSPRLPSPRLPFHRLCFHFLYPFWNSVTSTIPLNRFYFAYTLPLSLPLCIFMFVVILFYIATMFHLLSLGSQFPFHI